MVYLRDYPDRPKFPGFVLTKGDDLPGALFAHEKTWWNSSEVFVDEMFARPDRQRQGLGCATLWRPISGSITLRA